MLKHCIAFNFSAFDFGKGKHVYPLQSTIFKVSIKSAPGTFNHDKLEMHRTSLTLKKPEKIA